MNIELEQLEHLVAFDKYKTLSNAAKQLHLSQPILSRSMQKLEEGSNIIWSYKKQDYIQQDWSIGSRICKKNIRWFQ